MCDINKKTGLRRVVGYKVVQEIGGEFYSPFTGYWLRLGRMEREWTPYLRYNARDYWPGAKLYNENMLGRVTVFKDLEPCWLMVYKRIGLRVLEVELGGDIMEGTSKGMDGWFDVHGEGESNRVYVTYAGEEIVSMKEIKDFI